MKKTFALFALLLAAILTLAACGNDADPSGSSGDDGAATAQFNGADVAFAQNMIPHHQQAVQMAQMADDHAGSPEVKQLAEDIEAAQGPEIDQMTQWLEAWGQDVPSDSMGHDDMGHGDPSGGMPGMMDQEDMDRLDQASGDAWDQMFLTSMIEHHEGAIEMARREKANGKNPEAVDLAKKIETDQKAEIAKMRDMLNS